MGILIGETQARFGYHPFEDLLDGVKNDKRLENLELWSVSQPQVQRVEDKVAWVKEIIALYGDL